MGKYDVETTGTKIVEDLGENATGKILLITGASEASLGAEAAVTVAATKPKHIVLAGRTKSKVDPVIQSIKAVDPSIEVSFVTLDLLDNASVRKAAEDIKTLVPHIDILINSAGVMARKHYEISVDGVEKHFAANHLGHFLLTNLLLDIIIAVKGTIVNVSSMAYFIAEANTEDPNFEDGKTYHPWRAYGRSKTANVLFTFSLGKALKDKDIIAIAADPGMVLGTQLLANNGVDAETFAAGHEVFVERNGGVEPPELPRVTHQQGVATILRAALDPSLKEHAPCFLKECNPFPVIPYANDPENADKLWALSEKLVGEKFALA